MSFIFALKGRQGDKGEQGVQGEQGIQGEQGEQGEAGFCGYVDRGALDSSDFGVGDFTKDGNWHELDLSSFVPEGTKLIRIGASVASEIGNKFFDFRIKGYTSYYNSYSLRTQVNGVRAKNVFDVPVASDRKIEYRVQDVAWTEVIIVVMGWHL